MADVQNDTQIDTQNDAQNNRGEAGSHQRSETECFVLQRRLIRLGHLLSNRCDSDLRAHGLTSAQSAMLLFFAAQPGASCRDLSLHLQVTHQAVQKVVSRLRARSLLNTRVNAQDAREREVYLTAEGERLTAELRGHGEDAGRAAFASLTEAERRSLADMVDRMIADVLNGSAGTVKRYAAAKREDAVVRSERG